MAIVKKKVVEALQTPTALNSHKINPALPALQPVLAPKVVAVQIQQPAIASQLVQVVEAKPALAMARQVLVMVKLGRAAGEVLLLRLVVAPWPIPAAVPQPKQAASVRVPGEVVLVPVVWEWQESV